DRRRTSLERRCPHRRRGVVARSPAHLFGASMPTSTPRRGCAIAGPRWTAHDALLWPSFMDPGGHLRWYHNGTLPHFDQAGVFQAITFRLADSLPRQVLTSLIREAEERHPGDEAAQAEDRHRRVEVLLDAGWGSCRLRQDAAAIAVGDALAHGDGRSYDLLAWVVMPNHVHALIRQHPGGVLASIVRSWKVVSAKRLGGGRLWQRDYWDRYIRDERHFQRCIAYIHANPVQAGLVASAERWRWSSAFRAASPSGA
ncbi:MAG: transposase, partial [Planctomycetes bacterium]|nr:transposase [Planctomycetota bacterium]